MSGVIWVPYYFVIGSDLAASGTKGTFAGAAIISLFAPPALLAAVLMLVAPKRAIAGSM